MKLPGDEELRHLEDTAKQVTAACDADRVNLLCSLLRQLLNDQTNADVYCAIGHIMGMIAASKSQPSFAIPVITLLAMQAHMRYAGPGEVRH